MIAADIDQAALSGALNDRGFAVIKGAADIDTCTQLAGLYDDPAVPVRSTVTMARHAFGRGEYKYFARPLPAAVQGLRETLYPPLAAVARAWDACLGIERDWPATHAGLVERCAALGQTRPTPLILRYGAGDYNRLHQDLYGAMVFPLQAILLLDAPGRDFDGGELVLVEGRARMQSRPIVVPLAQGDIAVIPVRDRPVASARGWSRAAMRHGVSEIRSGQRRTLGIIFHDAT